MRGNLNTDTYRISMTTQGYTRRGLDVSPPQKPQVKLSTRKSLSTPPLPPPPPNTCPYPILCLRIIITVYFTDNQFYDSKPSKLPMKIEIVSDDILVARLLIVTVKLRLAETNSLDSL